MPTISGLLQTWTLRERGWRKTTPKASHSNMRSWTEPHRSPHLLTMLLIAALRSAAGSPRTPKMMGRFQED
jgi:hypothetical protein